MRLLWWLAIFYVSGWVLLIAAVWLAFRVSDWRARRRAPLAPVVPLRRSKGLGPGFGLSGGQARRRASGRKAERQGGM